MKKTIMTSICLAFYTISAPAVLAGESAPTRKVYYGDLDLMSDAGQKTLDRRLSRAVADVCGPVAVNDLGAMRDAAKCKKTAWASTRTQIALAVITAKRKLASYDGSRVVQSVRIETRR